MRIGLFDSGIGGLTVLKKLIKKYPYNEYIYYGDTKNIPFGDKSIDELKNISDNIVKFLLSKQVDIIIIACGTISSNLLNYLKSKYNIPIYDVISGTINYINTSEYNNITVLCTKQTKESRIFENINKNVEVVACPNLANLIENNDRVSIEMYIKEKIKEIKNKDLIILGCTHYPLIANILKKYENLPTLDMSDYIQLNCTNNSKFKLELYFSEINKVLLSNIKIILNNYKYIIKNK